MIEPRCGRGGARPLSLLTCASSVRRLSPRLVCGEALTVGDSPDFLMAGRDCMMRRVAVADATRAVWL
eukprot:5069645-Prymnesium_polylepis.1